MTSPRPFNWKRGRDQRSRCRERLLLAEYPRHAGPIGARRRCDRSGRRRAPRCRAAPESPRALPRAGRRRAAGTVRASTAGTLPLLLAWGARRGSLPRKDGAHRLRDLLERRVDERRAGGRERLAIHAPRDLEQRFPETGGEILFFDQARQQIGLAARHVGLEHRCGVLPDVAAENVEGRLMILGVAGGRLLLARRSPETGWRAST